jgi:hypothetical protein
MLLTTLSPNATLMVRDALSWRHTRAWVRVGGEWKIATVWMKQGGVWTSKR